MERANREDVPMEGSELEEEEDKEDEEKVEADLSEVAP